MRSAPPNGSAKRPRVSPNDIVREFIRMIRMRAYHPGDRVREQELANRFGVSRGPVREALRILEAKAILTVEPMKGATVARMSDQEASETVEIAAALFGVVARRAAERASDLEITAVRTAAERLVLLAETEIAPRRFYVETVRIGHLVAMASTSPRLVALLADVRTGWPNILGAMGFTTRTLRRRSAAKWRRLATALEQSNPALAERMAIEVHEDVAAEASRIRL